MYISLYHINENKWSLTLKHQEVIIVRRFGIKDWEVMEDGEVIKKFHIHDFQDALLFAYCLLEDEE